MRGRICMHTDGFCEYTLGSRINLMEKLSISCAQIVIRSDGIDY